MNSQKGFSALGLFLLGLTLLIIMSATGIFTPPKSEIEDKKTYQAVGSKNVNGHGILMTDLNFATPTLQPTTPQSPIIVPTAPPTPTRDPSLCVGYSKIQSCKCVDPYHISVYCEGRSPPATEDCRGNLSSCAGSISAKSDCVEYCAAKPVIYLYPKVPTYVDVEIITPGKFVESIPQIEVNRWTGVLAFPSGVLMYKNSYYRELFYDTSLDFVKAPNHGVFIESSKLKNELEFYIKKLGLIGDESDEFLTYWVPKLQALNKKYILFSVVDLDEKKRVDNVLFEPKPDTFIEFMAYFNGVDEKYPVKPLLLPLPPERLGFTAVEWGGVIEPSSYDEGSGFRN